jgi:putative mRNA 3-end processing factor
MFKRRDLVLVSLPNVYSSRSGMVVDYDEQKIYLDPRSSVECDYIFVSHAHIDHLHKTKSDHETTKVITSAATLKIAHNRGYELRNLCNDHSFRLLDAGHILGSNGLLIDDKLYYTGDISIRKRAFMKPATIPKTKTLIIESTFGREDYIFPSTDTVIHEVNAIISESYHHGRPVALLGYPLGKAQILTELFHHWEPLYAEDSIIQINGLYSELGVDISSHKSYSLAEKEGLLSRDVPWVLIAPLNSARNGFLDHIKRKYSPITIGFSGWGIKPNFKYILGLDYCFPISDHCDFNELITVVEKCSPEMVYTCHGFDDDFARTLRNLGFDAAPIRRTTNSDKKTIRKSAKITDWW